MQLFAAHFICEPDSPYKNPRSPAGVNNDLGLNYTISNHQVDNSIADQQETVDCFNGADFAAAFVNSGAQVLRIISDITLSEANWVYVSVPVLVKRNITLTGLHKAPIDYPILNLGLVRGKVSCIEIKQF